MDNQHFAVLKIFSGSLNYYEPCQTATIQFLIVTSKQRLLPPIRTSRQQKFKPPSIFTGIDPKWLETKHHRDALAASPHPFTGDARRRDAYLKRYMHQDLAH